jgi:membrane dipeptidase
MVLDWSLLGTPRADALDGASIEVTGWVAPAELAEAHEYFLLAPEPVCCIGCLPSDADCAIEVFARAPIANLGRPVRLRGIFHRLVDDPAGWRYQLRAAEPVDGADEAGAVPAVSRRSLIAAGASLALAACTAGKAADQPSDTAVRQALTGVTVDMHSHAGRIIRPSDPLGAVAAPMREGGMAVICLAIVADGPTLRIAADRRVVAGRNPEPGELYRWSRVAFGRIEQLVREQQLATVGDVAALHAAPTSGPAVVMAAEGADFLEGSLERLDEAYEERRLRHLQLTHYRVNELGDIQTAPPVHGGLTDFGAEVIRACNRRGIVVDVAHGTYDLIKRAASVTTRPMVLSHTSLARDERPFSRLISRDHARVIAATDGVVGVWPLSTEFPTKAAMAEGMAQMAEIVGIDHVGLGSDMLGLTVPSVFGSYAELPDLARALLVLFNPEEVGKLLGGNYARVFAASVG